jgi:beta-lactamase regulating signal transducer with metallopeptidase domain
MIRASWQGAAVVAGLWVVLFLWRRSSPAVRARLWLLAACKFLLVLFFVVELPVLRATQAASTETVLFTGAEVPAAAAAPFDARPWLFGLWAVGVAFIVGRAVAQNTVLRRLIREALPADERLAALGEPGMDIRVHADAPMPMVVGIVRSIVLLPESLVAELDDNEIRMVLAHEQAHLRRRDGLASLLMFSCFSLFYFHPLAYLTQREWQHDREAACDAEAMATLGVEPRSYAQMLLKVSVQARRAPALALSAAPSFRTLQRRINDMKHPSNKRRGSAFWSLLVIAMAAAATPIVLVEQTAAAAPVQTAPTPATSSVTAPTVAEPVPAVNQTRQAAPRPARRADRRANRRARPLRSAPAEIRGPLTAPASLRGRPGEIAMPPVEISAPIQGVAVPPRPARTTPRRSVAAPATGPASSRVAPASAPQRGRGGAVSGSAGVSTVPAIAEQRRGRATVSSGSAGVSVPPGSAPTTSSGGASALPGAAPTTSRGGATAAPLPGTVDVGPATGARTGASALPGTAPTTSRGVATAAPLPGTVDVIPATGSRAGASALPGTAPATSTRGAAAAPLPGVVEAGPQSRVAPGRGPASRVSTGQSRVSPGRGPGTTVSPGKRASRGRVAPGRSPGRSRTRGVSSRAATSRASKRSAPPKA